MLPATSTEYVEEPHTGQVTLHEAADERQWLCHGVTGEKQWLPEGSQWQLAYNNGYSFVYRGTGSSTETKWSTKLFEKSLHKDVSGRFFVMLKADGSRDWLDVMQRRFNVFRWLNSHLSKQYDADIWSLDLSKDGATCFWNLHHVWQWFTADGKSVKGSIQTSMAWWTSALTTMGVPVTHLRRGARYQQ